MSKRLAEGLGSCHWSILVGLLGASSTFLRLGCTDLKEIGRHKGEVAGGEHAQVGVAEESKGHSW